MAYKLTLDHPHFDKGVEFAISGLGVIPNGGSLTVDEDMERQFVAMRGMPLKDAVGSPFKISGTSELKPTERNELVESSPVADSVGGEE